MKKCFGLLILLSSHFLFGQSLRVSIFDNRDKSVINVQPIGERSYLMVDDSIVIQLYATSNVSIEQDKKNCLKILVGSKVFNAKKVRLIPEKSNDSFKFQLSSSIKPRRYKGEFEFFALNNKLKIINVIRIQDYLEGVLESESGYSENIEYYKVQAIISRTYAYKNSGRHENENFDVCDGVHCQAYYHEGTGREFILQSIHQTRNQVLVDTSMMPSTVFFHSNCGGQTVCPEDIWNAPIQGYYSLKDSFCQQSSQANWTKKILFSDWKKYLNDHFHITSFDDYSEEKISSFLQENRKVFLFDPKYGIPLSVIRNDFKLKSTFFDIEREGIYIVLKGRGFGHGVGLCQQGAMKMSKSGYEAAEILKYYFPNSRVLGL